MIIIVVILGLAFLALIVYLMWIGLAALITAVREWRKGWKQGWNKEKK